MSLMRGRPSLLRTLNSHAVLSELLEKGHLSRAELARSIGISLPTILEIVDNFQKRGLVREVSGQSNPRGRPAQELSVNPDAAQIICLDVGATSIKAGVFDFNKHLVSFTSVPTPRTSRQAVTDEIVRVIGDLRNASTPHACVVVGAPGFVRNGVVIEAANLTNWVNVPLQTMLEDRFGVPVAVENNVNLAVLGEAHFGVASDFADVVFLSIGAGLGTGILVDRDLVRGYRGAGGEISFIVPGIESLHTSYGEKGALEAFAATNQLCQYWNQITGQHIDDPSVIANAARADSPEAKQALHVWAQYLGVAIVALGAILNPEIVVIGGGGGHTFDLIEEDLTAYLKRHLPFPPILAQTALDERVALLGGVIVGLELMIQHLTSTA